MNQKIIIMKLKHKILTLIAGTLTTFALTSCNDFLDRDPLGQFTEDDAPNALIGGKMYNVYYLMRSYNITAGIPAFMIHMVRSEDSEKGSDAGDGADQAAMWDDFQLQPPMVRSVPIGDRTIKSSTSATKSSTTWRTAETRMIWRMYVPKAKPCSSAPTATSTLYVPGERCRW